MVSCVNEGECWFASCLNTRTYDQVPSQGHGGVFLAGIVTKAGHAAHRAEAALLATRFTAAHIATTGRIRLKLKEALLAAARTSAANRWRILHLKYIASLGTAKLCWDEVTHTMHGDSASICANTLSSFWGLRLTLTKNAALLSKISLQN